jgi:ATPase subunit of ABC transporter with duplicated ATPase domains
MLQTFGISLIVDPRVGPLFSNLSLSIGDGEKVALVGRNGVGKTRLLRILSGQDSPSSGQVVLSKGSSVAYLPQDFDHAFTGTMSDLYESVPYHALAKACHRVGLPMSLLDAPYAQLSLGEKMRGAIANLLASEPTILILDEPTNHLDGVAKEWLVGFLMDCPESVLLVCHDREVLNHVPTKIYELTARGLEEYSGKYMDMEREKKEAQARQAREWDSHQQETKRLKNAAEGIKQRAVKTGKKPGGNDYSPASKPFYDAKKARVEKQAKAVLGRVTREIKDAPDKPFTPDSLKLVFPTKPLRSSVALHVRGLTKSFGEKVLFKDLSLTVDQHARLAIVGANGSGKTTLLRILLSEEAADSGDVAWATDAQVATLTQARNAVKSDLPAFQAIGGDPEVGRTLLACLGMRGAIGERLVEYLSVGERTKVEIALMMMQGANVLVLDEPTNHLDIPSLEALEQALVDFPGVVIFVSHDREFISRIATEMVNLENMNIS